MSPSVFMLAFVLPFAFPPVAQDDSQADGNKLVKLTLVADRAEIQPGSTFTLAAKCRIEPRWHIYWGENQGLAGIPTAIEITGPAGYEIGKVRFPWPKRHEMEGDIVEYIHEGEMTALVDVTVPADAKPGTQAEFKLAARWLVCTTVCFSGSGKTSITLPVAEKEKAANEDQFKTWRARLAKPWSEMTRNMASWSGDAKAPKLTLVVAGATGLEFFPYVSKTTELVGRKIEIGQLGGTLTLDLELIGKEKGDVPAARGVLWVKMEKGESAYVLDQTYRKP